MTLFVLITCEHASRRIPARYAELFRDAEAVLASHRGWDPGSLALGRAIQRRLAAPLIAANWSRLLIEPNRSPRHPRLFSEYTRTLPAEERARLVRRYYRPHRDRVEAALAAQLAAGRRAMHLGIHTFTPVLEGRRRTADIGLLYDPARPWEGQLCAAWQVRLRRDFPGMKIRRNVPYRGAADGLTTSLRRQFAPHHYAGIELEVNQWHVFQGCWRRRCCEIAASAARWMEESARDSRLDGRMRAYVT